MGIDRRRFLAGGLALLVLRSARGHVPGEDGPRYITCREWREGHAASAFDRSGRLAWSTPLPGRGHGIALAPGGADCAVVARRPGRLIHVLDAATGRVRQRLTTPGDRHCFGHGAYSADGARLFVAENDFEAGRGLVAIYDAAGDYRRLGEIPSHGVGPHEIRLLADGYTLAVANGGILTHPDYGRAKLNLDTMSPSLALVDTRDGRLLAEHRLAQELHQLSIRHIDTGPDGTVAVAMQHQGAASERVPLVGVKPPGAAIRLLEPPPRVAARMRNYCGSVRFDAGGSHFAVSAPRGGLVTLWTKTGDYLGHVDLVDGCGIAPRPDGGFVLSSGTGRVVIADRDGIDGALTFPGSRWDNHMVVAG